MILELTLDMPLLWFIAGTAFLYVLIVFVSNGNYRKLHLGQHLDQQNKTTEANVYIDPLLIVRSFLIVKRKIPSIKEKCSINSDDVPSILYEVRA